MAGQWRARCPSRGRVAFCCQDRPHFFSSAVWPLVFFFHLLELTDQHSCPSALWLVGCGRSGEWTSALGCAAGRGLLSRWARAEPLLQPLLPSSLSSPTPRPPATVVTICAVFLWRSICKAKSDKSCQEKNEPVVMGRSRDMFEHGRRKRAETHVFGYLGNKERPWIVLHHLSVHLRHLFSCTG